MRLLSTVLLLCIMTSVANSTEDSRTPDKEQSGATEADIQATLSLSGQFDKPNVLAFGPDSIRTAVERATAIYPNIHIDGGDTSIQYDVIIQPGHYLRKKGATGGQGKLISEQVYVAWIADMLRSELTQRNVNAITIGADNYTHGLKTKMFLALHTDSAKLPCAVGPSVAYFSAANGPQMHTIALALALSTDREPSKFMRDNYTKAEADYYAYKTITGDVKGLLEMGELTCEEEEKALLGNAEFLAKNLAKGIIFALRPSSR